MQRDPDLDQKVIDDYQHGRGTIQQIAIFYNITVDEVLKITGNTDLLEVEVVGDLVDASEAGPDVAISRSKKYKVNYDASKNN